jgi:hypothetical protein
MLRAATGGSLVGEAGVSLVAPGMGVGVCGATVAAGGRAGGGATHAASSRPIMTIVFIGIRIISAHSSLRDMNRLVQDEDSMSGTHKQTIERLKSFHSGAGAGDMCVGMGRRVRRSAAHPYYCKTMSEQLICIKQVISVSLKHRIICFNGSNVEGGCERGEISLFGLKKR